MVKTGDNQCMGLLKRWLKTSERPWKVHSKWNSTVNRDLNVEPVTTADGWLKQVRGREMFIQNGTLNRDLWLRLIHQFFDALFSLLLLYCYHCADIVGIVYHLLLSFFIHNIIIIIIVGIYYHLLFIIYLLFAV